MLQLKKIQLVMAGENGEIEYGGTQKNKNKSDQPFKDFVPLYHKGTSFNEILNQGIKDKILNKSDLINPSLKYYALPSIKTLEKEKLNSPGLDIIINGILKKIIITLHKIVILIQIHWGEVRVHLINMLV